MSKPLLRRFANRFLARLAQALPGSTNLRPALHRLRGCTIGKDVFVGDRCYIAAGPNAVVQIGDGSFIGACTCIVNRSIEPGALITPAPFQEVAVCETSLAVAKSYQEFVRGIRIPRSKG